MWEAELPFNGGEGGAGIENFLGDQRGGGGGDIFIGAGGSSIFYVYGEGGQNSISIKMSQFLRSFAPRPPPPITKTFKVSILFHLENPILSIS